MPQLEKYRGKNLKPMSVAIAISLAAGFSAHAVEMGDPIAVSAEVEAWSKSFASSTDAMIKNETYPKTTGRTQCRAVQEIAGTHLCQSNTPKGMNMALARASCFIEGAGCGYPKGHVLDQNDQAFRAVVGNAAGHDLKGSDLIRFYDQVTEECRISRSESICLNATEKDLFENFILPRAKDENFVLIAFSRVQKKLTPTGIQESPSWQVVVTHETLHAQYFSDPAYREAVDAFWNREMSEAEREKIRAALSKTYDPADELLMKNEFQAYILMSGADESMLESVVPKYRKRLLAALASKGIRPIQVK